MTTIRRRALTLAAAIVTTLTSLIALASTALAQVPVPDATPVQQPPTSQIAHPGLPTWLLVAGVLLAVALAVSGVAAAARVRHTGRVTLAHG